MNRGIATGLVRRLAAGAAALAVATAAGVAQAQMTGKEAYDGCRRGMQPMSSNHIPPPNEIVAAGRCFGVVEAAFDLGRSLSPAQRHCAPADAAPAAVGVVVAFLARHRERFDEPFAVLAVAAMREKWPCG